MCKKLPKRIQIGFLIDETCSQKKSEQLINAVAKELINKVQIIADKISDYVLVTVNDVSHSIERNVALRLTTQSAKEFLDKILEVK